MTAVTKEQVAAGLPLIATAAFDVERNRRTSLDSPQLPPRSARMGDGGGASPMRSTHPAADMH